MVRAAILHGWFQQDIARLENQCCRFKYLIKQELQGSALDQVWFVVNSKWSRCHKRSCNGRSTCNWLINNDLSLSISYQLVSFPDHSLERLQFPVSENPSLYLKEAQLELAKCHRSKHNKSNRKRNVIQTTIEYTCDVKIASPQQHCIEKNPHEQWE